MLVLLLSYSKSLFVGVTWASLIVFFIYQGEFLSEKKLKKTFWIL